MGGLLPSFAGAMVTCDFGTTIGGIVSGTEPAASALSWALLGSAGILKLDLLYRCDSCIELAASGRSGGELGSAATIVAWYYRAGSKSLRGSTIYFAFGSCRPSGYCLRSALFMLARLVPARDVRLSTFRSAKVAIDAASAGTRSFVARAS